MSHFLIDVWNQLKPYIQSKDREIASERLVSIFDEYGHTDGIEFEAEVDRYLRSAVKSVLHLDEEENEEEESDYGDDSDEYRE